MKTRKLDHNNRILLAGSTASLVASIMTAGAQTTVTNAPARMNEVLVTATNSPSLTVPDVYTAKAELRRVPGGAEVIPAESFLTGRASTMKDVLDYSAGVFVQPRFGSDEARLSIRGSGIQRTFHGRGLKLLQDGVPLNLADGGFDMQAIEPLAVSYVEVLRGANALRYGGTTLGGAINYVMPTGHDTDKVRLRVEAGSYGYLKTHASSGLAEGKNDYYTGYTYSALDGFREHAQQNAHRVFSNIGHRFNDNVETRVYFTYVQTYSELPGSLTKTQLENNPDMANAANIAGDQQRNFELIRAASKTSWRNDNHSLDVSVFWSHKDLFHPIFQVVDQNSNDAGLDLRYRNLGDLFGRPNQLTVGFSPVAGRTENSNFINVGGTPGAKAADSTQASYNLDLYVENQHWLTDKWSLLTGVQVSQSRRDFDDTFGIGDFTADYWGVSPKVGVIYDLQPDWQFYGNVSRSFEPPSMSELGVIGPAPVVRDAQSGWTIELGTRGEREWFSWDLSYYHAWLENELLSFETFPASGVFTTINASTTIHQGVELKENVRLFKNLFTSSDIFCEQDGINWTTAYMWNDFRFQDDGTFGDNDLPGIPKHYLRSEVVYAHPKGFYFGPNIEWSPVKYAVDMGNSLFADPYLLLGVKAGYRTKKGFSVFVEGRNLMDKNYAATTGVITVVTPANQAQFLPGDGRAFYAGLEWKW